MSTVDEQAVAAFMATDEYQRLGVLGRERLLYERFPALEERHRQRGQRHLERSLFGRPLTPDPDRPEGPGE